MLIHMKRRPVVSRPVTGSLQTNITAWCSSHQAFIPQCCAAASSSSLRARTSTMASPGAELPSAQQEAGPSAPPVDPPVVRSENDIILENFFQCGAKELALKLIGRYLRLHDDNIKVRILETEAYPEGDDVYNQRFPNAVKARFRALKGGTLLAWGPPATPFGHGFQHIYISAGPVGTGDVVLIRSCEPIEGEEELQKRRRVTNLATRKTRKNLLINPLLVSAGLGGNSWNFTTDPILYSGQGARLLPGHVARGESMKHGTRVLKDDDVDGADSMLRFALKTSMNYSYDQKSSLVDYPARVLIPMVLAINDLQDERP